MPRPSEQLSARESFPLSLREIFSRIRENKAFKRTGQFIERKPFTSFFVTLGMLLLIIILGNVIASLSKKVTPLPTIVKDVSVYRNAQSPSISLQGQVEKSGVYKILAQTAGVVQAINLQEGDSVKTGQSIVTLSSDYQGDNAPALQSGLAQRQYQNVLDTFSTQKSLISDQRNVATASARNTQELNHISDQARGDTNGLIGLTQSMLDSLNSQITTLQNSGNTDPATLQQIQTLKGSQAQLQGSLNQLNNASRSLDYQNNTANPPTLLASLQESITLKQLDVQEKALDLNRDASRIQANLAAIQASLMNPSSPSNGVIDRVFIKVGDSIQPGTMIAAVVGDKQSSTIVVHAPETLARQISRVDASTIHMGTTTLRIVPSYVSLEATDGQLYSVLYQVPSAYLVLLTDASYITVDIPLTSTPVAVGPSTDPYIPLDAIYQTQDQSYVYVVKNGKAETRTVMLGDVYGRFVSVLTGIGTNDQVILNRNVVAEDRVKPTN